MTIHQPHEQKLATGKSRRRIICHSKGQFQVDVDPADISEIIGHNTIGKTEDFLWLDLADPSEEDIALLSDEFGFHHLSIEDATRHHERPKVEAYDGYYFLVFYEVHFDQQSQQLATSSIGLFIGPNYLVSVHDGDIQIIDETIVRWRKNETVIGWGGGALLYHLLDAIVDGYFPVIDQLADRVEGIEEQIFERFRQSALQEVFKLKRDLLGIRRIVAPERDVLNVLIRREVPVFDQDTIKYLQDVYDHIIRITDSIDTYRDLLSSALDAFLSIQSNQLNQVVKVLTITSIVLMSCSLVAGIYGMNFEFIPELHWAFGYPFALGLMVAISGALILFFKKQEWL
ncbi:MAG: magnesium/cobalt transporter CorA [Roseiflexaceae bacterium]|nr:magnesium/cobalt transporter CorA [Roseiflexaceae bacterium]